MNALQQLRLAVAAWQREAITDGQTIRMGNALARIEALAQAAEHVTDATGGLAIDATEEDIDALATAIRHLNEAVQNMKDTT